MPDSASVTAPIDGQQQPARPVASAARSFTLDTLRVSAVAALLISHIAGTVRSPLGNYFGIPGFYYVTLGGTAVTVFLVLSGMVLQLRYGDERIDYGRFVFKRVLRIYPVYYLSLALGVLVLGLQDLSGLRSLAAVLTADLPLMLTGTYAFAGQWGGPVVATSWYIGLIMALYLLFPLLSRSFARAPYGTLAVLLAISVASRLLLGTNELLPNRPLDWFPLCRIFEFGLGIFAVSALGAPWREVTPPPRLGDIIRHLGGLSFPLFLVHIYLLFLIPALTAASAPLWLAVAAYVAISLIASEIVVRADDLIPRAKLMSWYDAVLQRQPA